MADCFLFLRCWPGFSEPFPFDRFDGIAGDEELSRALDSWAREEIRRPEARRAIMQVARLRKQRYLAGIQKRRGAYAGRPGRPRNDTSGSSFWTCGTERDVYWPRIRQPERPEPLVCRFGADLGWWRQVGTESLPFGPRVWFHQVPSSELAEAVVSALNGRTDLHFEENKLEYYLRPRFGFVEDADTALRISALRCIDLIRRGEVPEVRDGEVALAVGKKAMRLADEMVDAATRLAPGARQEESAAEPEEATETVDDSTEVPAHVESVDNVPIGGNGGRANEGGEIKPRKRKQSDKSKYVDDLMEICDSVKAKEPDASSQDVADKYNNKYKAPIANQQNSRKRATAKWVKGAVYDRRKRPDRKQNNE